MLFCTRFGPGVHRRGAPVTRVRPRLEARGGFQGSYLFPPAAPRGLAFAPMKGSVLTMKQLTQTMNMDYLPMNVKELWVVPFCVRFSR